MRTPPRLSPGTKRPRSGAVTASDPVRARAAATTRPPTTSLCFTRTSDSVASSLGMMARTRAFRFVLVKHKHSIVARRWLLVNLYANEWDVERQTEDGVSVRMRHV